MTANGRQVKERSSHTATDALAIAKQYVAAGISVVPIRRDGSKAASVAWKQYTKVLPTARELHKWFAGPEPFGIATVGGAVSGALEILDFDREAATIFPAWCQLVEAACPGLVERLSIAATPAAGFHVRYRCPNEDIPGNTQLAIDPSAPADDRVLVETRGEGGYALAPGSPAECHDTGRLYQHQSGPLIPPSLTPDERDVLLTCARSFSRQAKEYPRQVGLDLRPGDDFDRHGPDWAAILEPHGWRCVCGSPGGERRWRRPGKEGVSWSATTGHCRGQDGADLFHVFSSNASPFEAGMSYGKFRVYALLNHGGDLSAAADALVKEGYGSRHTSNGRCENGAAVAEPWDDPLPLGNMPAVESFPLAVLPAPMARLVDEISWAMNCAPDLAGVALLTLAGGAVANGRHLAITDTHIVSPCLYAVVVAPPGATKSPPLRLLRRPFDLAENDNRKHWRAEMEAWKEAEKDERGPKPIQQRCLVGNITTESLSLILDENPRGVVMVRNELSGLIAGLNQYKQGGDDRQFYLDLWDGSPIVTDRKSDRLRDGAPIFVLDAFTAIYGAIQPDVMTCMRSDASQRQRAVNDGFLDRFLFAYPPNRPAVGEQWRAVSSAARAAWDDVVRELLSLRMREESGNPPRPVWLRLSPDGRIAWQRFTEAIASETNQEDFPPHLRGPWTKLRAYGARLALILRCLRWACQQAQHGENDALEDVDGESMTGAAQLVNYFKSHARKVYAAIDADLRLREAKRVLRWLGNSLNSLNSLKGSKVVSKSELHAGVWGGSKSVEDVEGIIALLVRYGWLRLLLEEERKGPGRRASPRYEVHPQVLKTLSDISENSENCSREPGEEG